MFKYMFMYIHICRYIGLQKLVHVSRNASFSSYSVSDIYIIVVLYIIIFLR